MGVRLTAAALTLLLGVSTPALAAKTDIVILRNGDRLTGEVTQLRQGKLQVKTDDAGTLSIEWDKIAGITTAALYDVTLTDGQHLLGRFTPAAPRYLNLIALGGTSTTVAMEEIVSLSTIKTKFFQRIDGSMDLGGSYTESSGVGELYFSADATYRRPSFLVAADFSTNLTRQKEAPETSRYSLNTGYTRFARGQWFVSGLGLFESNRELGFTFRGTGAVSVGRYLRRSRHVELLAAGGIAAGGESPVDHEAVTNVDALVTADLSVFTYDYPTTRVDVTFLMFPSLDDPGRLRLNTNLKFKREIFHDVFFSVSGYDAYDNRPKGASTKSHDFGVSLSFGWTF
jgi:hypothetical protein